jgi:hypothetical protein
MGGIHKQTSGYIMPQFIWQSVVRFKTAHFCDSMYVVDYRYCGAHTLATRCSIAEGQLSPKTLPSTSLASSLPKPVVLQDMFVQVQIRHQSLEL